MARKKENTADWFPHYIPTKGTRVRILKQRFGATGYLAYFTLLEYLTVTDNHYLDFQNEREKLAYQAEIGADDVLFDNIMDSIWRLEIIDRDLWLNEQIIWCQELVDSLSQLYKNRGRSAPNQPSPKEFLPKRKRFLGVDYPKESGTTHISTPKNPQSRVEHNVNIETPEFWFKVRGEIIQTKVSTYFRENFQIFLDQFKDKKLIEPTLQQMDDDYITYDFRDENHVKNSFKFVAAKLGDPKKQSNTSKQSGKVASVLSASEKLNLPE